MNQEQMAICEVINKHFASRYATRANWLWRVPFSTKKKDIGDDYTKEEIFEYLDECYTKLKDFEAALLAKLSEEEIRIEE